MEKFPEEVGSLILSLAANAKGLWNVQAGRQMNPLRTTNKCKWTASSQTAFCKHADRRGWKLHKQHSEDWSENNPS